MTGGVSGTGRGRRAGGHIGGAAGGAGRGGSRPRGRGSIGGAVRGGPAGGVRNAPAEDGSQGESQSEGEQDSRRQQRQNRFENASFSDSEYVSGPTPPSRGRQFNPQRQKIQTSSLGTNPFARPSSQPLAMGDFGTKSFGAKALGQAQGSRTAPTASVTYGAPSRQISPQSYKDRLDALEASRVQERQAGIANGLIHDPSTRRRLEDAITTVGTCEDMCPEYERMLRITRHEVWPPEAESSSLGKARSDRIPIEACLVKTFKRPAAGEEEQLPSDLRTAGCLERTIHYLFNDIIGDAESLASVQPFLWDRTRAVRNDFSIQQFKDFSRVKISMDCHERIARFHLLSSHQMTHPDLSNSEYSHQQDLEQLDKTFLTLRYMYEDHADMYQSPNEAEFRAYQILFSIHHRKPDVEAQWGKWPQHIRDDRRVQQAMRIYIAAQTIKVPQGPLRPYAGTPVAKAQWIGFWRAVQSPFTTYLMACATERFFNYVREQVLKAIWECYRTREPSKKTIDWSYQDLTEALGFDDEEQTMNFVKCYGFGMYLGDDGLAYMQDSADHGKEFSGPLPGNAPRPLHSYKLAEFKRGSHDFASVISGLPYDIKVTERIAIVDGFPYKVVDDDETEVFNEDEEMVEDGNRLEQQAEELGSEDENPLFISDGKAPKAPSVSEPILTSGTSILNPGATLFAPSNAGPNSFVAATSWGKPSSASATTTAASPFASPFSTSLGSRSFKTNPFEQGSKFGKPSSTIDTSLFPPSLRVEKSGATGSTAAGKSSPSQSTTLASPFNVLTPNSQGASGSTSKDYSWKATQPISFGPGAPTSLPPATSSPSSNDFSAKPTISNDSKGTQESLSSLLSNKPSQPQASITSSAAQPFFSTIGNSGENQPTSSTASSIATSPSQQQPGSSLFDRIGQPKETPVSSLDFPGASPLNEQIRNNVKSLFQTTNTKTDATPSSNFGQSLPKSASNQPSASQPGYSLGKSPLYGLQEKAQSVSELQAVSMEQNALGNGALLVPATSQPSGHQSILGQQSSGSSSEASPITVSQPLPSLLENPKSTNGGLFGAPKTALQPVSTPDATTATSIQEQLRTSGHAFNIPSPAIIMAPRHARVGCLYDLMTYNTVLKLGDGVKGGLLKQYIEHLTFLFVQEEQRKILDERNNELADRFRRTSLQRKYGRLWHRITYKSRKKREGRERRKQMSAALQRRQGKAKQGKKPIMTVGEEFAAFIAAEQQRRSAIDFSQASEASSPSRIENAPQDTTDDFGRSVLSLNGSVTQKLTRTSIREQRRARGQLSTTPDPANRVHKRNSISSMTSSISSRLSRPDYRFLSFDSILENPSEVKKLSTMKSSYFRLKAAGVDVMGDWNDLEKSKHSSRRALSSLPGLKRRRSIDDDAGRELQRQYSPPHDMERGRHSLDTTRPYRSEYAQTLQLDKSTGQVGRTNIDSLVANTQALIAQARASMAGLTEDIKEMQDEIGEWRREESDSGFLTPRRALEHDMNGVSASGEEKRRLPKFWGRVSAFVPRSEYGLRPHPKQKNEGERSYLGTSSRTVDGFAVPALPNSSIRQSSFAPVQQPEPERGGTSFNDAIEL